jgi:hypothetical protein
MVLGVPWWSIVVGLLLGVAVLAGFSWVLLKWIFTPEVRRQMQDYNDERRRSLGKGRR